MNRLSVVHLSMWDNAGGSGRAAYRLHTGLKNIGVRSRMLVGRKTSTDPDVRLIGGAWRPLDRLCGAMTDALDLQYLFYPSSLFLPSDRWIREADVIQIFNTHGGYLSHLSFPALSRRRPIVWRLSDMWALTGHCAYSYECDRWKSGCGACPHLSEYPGLKKDRTAFLWRVKKQVYSKSRMTLVAPSTWIFRLASESPLLNRFQIRRIPNGLDTTTFRPIPKQEARNRLGLDPNKRIVLFSAAAIQDERKGGALLTQALTRLTPQDRHNLLLLVVGQGAESIHSEIPIPVKTMPAVGDDNLLAQVYSAADLFLLPTLADNLPNSILESMACGTPAVSFDVGGISDAVRQMETGYLAREGDAEDLAAGIQKLLADEPLRKKLGEQARRLIEQEHTLELQTRRFKDLYEELAGRQG